MPTEREPIELTLAQARQLAIVKQRLGGKQAKPTTAGIKDVARSIRVIQIDPISAVDRTQNLVLWSRIGAFDRKKFDNLVFADKFLFHYWAHAASLILTDDLPLHRWRMKSFLDRSGKWHDLLKKWMEANRSFGDYVLRELRKHGEMRSRDFEDRSVGPWPAGGYGTSVQNVGRMLDLLWGVGKITIVGRDGGARVWGLFDGWLPESASRDAPAQKSAVETAIQHSLRALGVATPQHVAEHYTRGSYPDLPKVLAGLVEEGAVHPARVTGDDGHAVRGPWFVHSDDIGAIGRLDEASTPRTTLLSPFDNLICDRKRTELLWDFHYRIGIYTPKAQRKYGYYALPILHRDKLIGRVDSQVDRARGPLVVNALHFEPSVKPDREIGAAVMGALNELADFVSEGNLELAPSAVPKAWRSAIPA
jgi:uncharacterized protein YcaQ